MFMGNNLFECQKRYTGTKWNFIDDSNVFYLHQ